MNARLDLFTPLVPRDRWHPNFVRAHDSASSAEREVLLNWSAGFRDRDGKFVKEFQTTFNSSFWELYLHALFTAIGCERDQSFSRPDFVITSGTIGSVAAEAVIADNPMDGTPEWGVRFDDRLWQQDRETLLDLASLRLAQAITSKHRKWLDAYSELPQCKERPYLICIAPFEQPFAQMQGTEAIDRVLFKGPRRVLSEDGRQIASTLTDAAFKPSGAAVRFGLFTDDAMPSVSGVLFSSTATWSKVRAMAGVTDNCTIFQGSRFTQRGFESFAVPAGEYVETIKDGAHLFVNPYAKIPLEPDRFLDADIVVHEAHEGGTRTWFGERGSLIMRQVFEIRVESAVKEHSFERKPDHVPALPPDGVAFAGPSSTESAEEVTLELYRGWTLFVGRHTKDRDWAVLAKRIVTRSIEAFIDIEVGEQDEFLTGFYPTREEAIVAARTTIDPPIQNDDSSKAEAQ